MMRHPITPESSVTARSEAKLAGKTFYISDQPCKKGHKGPRYVSTGNCVQCIKFSRVIKNNQLAGNAIMELPIPYDLAEPFAKFARLVLIRDPDALSCLPD